ncbi:hypothetical protein ACS0TY_009897 [Phlomoides rotata]
MSTPKVEMKKGPWTRDEDQKLLAYIQEHGHGSWRTIPEKAGLERCGKSCRLRWTNYLRPDIKRGKFSSHEEKSIIRLHALLGNRWSVIAAHLPNRTDNEIKNYWNTRLKKRLTRMGIDPTTHKPKNNQAGSAQSKHAAAVNHMAQWETARLEAEARLARESKLQLLHRATAAPPPPRFLDVLKVWQATVPLSSFFNSAAGALESPTSTLNFPSNNLTVPTVCSIMENDVVSINNYSDCGTGVGQVEWHAEMRGKMENPLQLGNDDVIYPVSYECDVMIGSMDHTSYNYHDSVDNLVGPVLGGDEESDISYWNDLLDLVNSTMVSPMLM